MALFSGCDNDASFGPAVVGCRDDFDFTIKFEKIVFAFIPAAVFITACPLRIAFLLDRPSGDGGVAWPLRLAKLIVIGALAAVHLALIIILANRGEHGHGRLEPYLIAASAVTFLSALFLGPISDLEHLRSRRPSILINAYLAITLLLDVAQTRTLWLASTNGDEALVARLFPAGLAVKALLLVLEVQHKTPWTSKTTIRAHSPEETSGLFELSAFLWLYRLFLMGYRNVMTLDDVYPLDPKMGSGDLATRLEAVSRYRHKHGLTRALVRALAIPFLIPIIPRIALGVFQFCQPFLIRRLLDYLQSPASSSDENISYGLIGATILIYAGMLSSLALYWYFQERAVFMARGALAGAIYRQTTKAIISTTDDSASLTLMSNDIDAIIMGCRWIHEFWANTIQAVLACWLLSRQIGIASIAPLIVVGLCVVCTAMVGRLAGPRQKAWMEKVQKRVGLTASVISQMKNLKMSGLAPPVESLIQGWRVDELKTATGFRLVLVISAVLGYTPLCLAPVVTFPFASTTLDVSTIFTSMSYILLLANPLGLLFQFVPVFLGALACLNRIQGYLQKDAREDFRNRPGKDIDEKNDEGRPDGSAAIHISGGNFGWKKDKFSMSDININIPFSRLAMIVGPVASGKSTLCKALLGEIPVASGRIWVDGRTSCTMGYCDQTPYLSNSTIRENIIGFSPFDSIRYQEVIEASMLLPDIAAWPQGDETIVGSNGIILSGGQKQRVSMARALYLDTNLVVFDDVLSGLDADTEQHVFRNVLAPGTGLLRRRGTTIVLCTHSVKHLRLADHVIALGSDGRVVEQGTFENVMANKQYVYSLQSAQEEKAEAEEGDKQEQSIPSAAKDEKPSASPNTTKSNATKEKPGDKSRMLRDTSVYRHYFSRINKIIILAFLLFGIGWGFFLNFTTIWLKFWAEDIQSDHPRRTNGFYNGIYALLQLLALASLCLLLVTNQIFMIQSSGTRLHHEALRTVMTAPLQFLNNTDVGVVTNLFSQDMTLVDGILPISLVNFAMEGFAALGMAAVIATASPWLMISYPFLIVVVYGIASFYLRTSRQMRLLELEAKSPLYTHFIDTMKNVATFRAFGWTQNCIDQNTQLLDASQRPAYLQAMIQQWLGFTVQLAVGVLAIIVVVLATQLSWANQAFTGASLVALMSFGESLRLIVRMSTELETSVGAVSRLKKFGEDVHREDGGRDGKGGLVVLPPEWPVHGSIRLDGVSASYE